MYSPDEQGEYTPVDGAQAFTVQGLTEGLLGLESEDTVVEPPEEELIVQVIHAHQHSCGMLAWLCTSLRMILL